MTLSLVNPTKPIRMHTVAHFEHDFFIDDRETESYFRQPWDTIHTWEQAWEMCAGWEDEAWRKTRKGRLTKGIAQSNGNGIRAVVQDKDGAIYYLHGVWG